MCEKPLLQAFTVLLLIYLIFLILLILLILQMLLILIDRPSYTQPNLTTNKPVWGSRARVVLMIDIQVLISPILTSTALVLSLLFKYNTKSTERHLD